VIDTATNTVVGSPITVGLTPRGVAVTPDGSKVYVAYGDSNTVSVIDTATNTVVGSPITVGGSPFGVAVTPDGSKVYVTNFFDNTVSVIDTATNTVVGSPITVGRGPIGVAVTPDGSKVYVVNRGSKTVLVIDTATNTVVGSPIPLPDEAGGFSGNFAFGVAVTPNGSKVYVTDTTINAVSVIHTATNTVVGSPITVGRFPQGVAVTPDGSKVYVTNNGDGTVSVIATATNTVVGSPITVGNNPLGVAVTPDGSKVYVTNLGNGVSPGTVSVIATATNTVVGPPIIVGVNPFAFGLFIQPVLVFSAQTELTVYPNTRVFKITNSNFSLGASSSDINPPTEPVMLQIGSFKITIPPGSFVKEGPGDFKFVGVIDNVQLVVSIRLVNRSKYSFAVEARDVSLTVTNPVPITLVIGNESGTTTVNAVIINTG
jgi:YVTN family beta-propeller protein